MHFTGKRPRVSVCLIQYKRLALGWPAIDARNARRQCGESPMNGPTHPSQDCLRSRPEASVRYLDGGHGLAAPTDQRRESPFVANPREANHEKVRVPMLVAAVLAAMGVAWVIGRPRGGVPKPQEVRCELDVSTDRLR